MTREFKTTGSTSIHGEFPVSIIIEHTEYTVNSQKTVATITGQEWEMYYNISTRPEDRIQAGVVFAKTVGCKIHQSIKCDTKQVSAFIAEIEKRWMNSKLEFEQDYRRSQRNHDL